MKCKEFKKWLANMDATKIEPDTLSKAHMKVCSQCRELYQLDKELEQIVQKEFLSESVPSGVVHRIDSGLERDNTTSFFTGLNFHKLIPATVIPVIALFFILSYMPSDYKNLQHISNLAVQYHLKSEYEMTFTTKGMHEGNEKLNRELGYKVLIPDLSKEGYQFVGGRKCTLGNRDVAYIFYKNQGKINSLFILNNNYLDFTMSEGGEYKDVNKGCPIKIWKTNSQVYAFVN